MHDANGANGRRDAVHLEQLYFFLHAAEVQHFTKASQDLHVSQPALSRSLKKLEQELGIELFRKSGRGVELTENGRIFAQHALKGLQELNAGIAFAHSQAGTLTGELTLGGIITARSCFMLPLLDEYQQRCPNVTVTDHLGVSVDLRTNVLEGKYDAVIAGPIDNPSLAKRPIYSQQLVLYAPTFHRASQFTKVSLDDLRNMEVATYGSDTLPGRLIDSFFAQQGLNPEGHFRNLTRTCSEETTLAHQVIRNKCVGIGLLTSHLLPYPNLIAVPFDEEPTRHFFDVSLYYRNDLLQSPCLQAFVDCFDETASSIETTHGLEHAKPVRDALEL